MQATVILNRNAGSAGDVDPRAFVRALEEAGYEASARETADLDDLDVVLDDSDGLVVCVGGDGTLRATVLRMRGRDRPLALVPMGTANNVAASLGLDRERDPLSLLTRLREPRRCAFDLGRATTSRGERLFLEACGFGLYAKLLETYRPEDGKDVLRAIGAVQEVMIDFDPAALTVDVEGGRYCGPFVLATVMNTRRMGLRVPLAPSADPCDGLLDLVLIRHEDGHSLIEYGSRLLRDTLEEAVNVVRVPIRHCTIHRGGGPFHVDDAVEGSDPAGDDDAVTIDVVAGALEMWLPSEEHA